MSDDCADWSIRPQLGSGGGVPNPRKLRPASARMASANDTDACTIITPVMFGSTCRVAMYKLPRFAVRAAAT